MKMKRLKLSERELPAYSKAEEIFNMVSHITGGALGIIFLVLTVVVSALKKDAWAITGSAIYGASLITLYSMSAIYHGLKTITAKKVFQVLDHCTIYFLIAGTYTPILLTAIRRESPAVCFILFTVVWGLTALAVTLTAIDLKKYSVFSMICYIGMGWCIIFAFNTLLKAVSLPGVILLVAGGVAYTLGAVLYGLGKKVKFMHSVFHLFVVAGSILQFLCILFYVL